MLKSTNYQEFDKKSAVKIGNNTPNNTICHNCKILICNHSSLQAIECALTICNS